MNKKPYLISLVLLSLILISSLIYSIHQRGRIAELEKKVAEVSTYKSSPGISKNSNQTENNLPTKYKQAIKEYINNNIEEIVNEKHYIGGKWVITNLEFLSPTRIQIYFEDGHTPGNTIIDIDELKITDVKYQYVAF